MHQPIGCDGEYSRLTLSAHTNTQSQAVVILFSLKRNAGIVKYCLKNIRICTSRLRRWYSQYVNYLRRTLWTRGV